MKAKVPFVLLALAALACTLNIGTNDPASTAPPEEIAPSATTGESGQAPATKLPRALYYLSDNGTGVFNVWRLGADGPAQVTSESSSISEFDVSPADGTLAYVMNNQLILLNADGSNRRVAVDGRPPDEFSNDYQFRRRISGLSFSPDGETLAFGFNGLKLYSVSTGAVTLVAQNLVSEEGGELFPQALYSPLMWSPDGSRLLVSVGFFEGASLSAYEPALGAIIGLGTGLVCCHPAWTLDSSAVLVASPFTGLLESGLWSYSASNGETTVLIPGAPADGTFNFAGWPMQLPNGDLQYFFASAAAIPSGSVPLSLVRSAADGVTNRTQLRPETFLLYEALWYSDGSAVVVVQQAQGASTTPRVGAIVLIPTNSGLATPLAASGYQLKWGP